MNLRKLVTLLSILLICLVRIYAQDSYQIDINSPSTDLEGREFYI